MSRFCPSAWHPVVHDWKEPGGWQTAISQLERDNRARLIDRPPALTFAQVAAAVLLPGIAALVRFTARHGTAAPRALWSALRAAVTTYRESINA
jgi:hypothetical protein